jgi:hypothetical protein
VVLGYEEGHGVFPFRWFFDTADFRRVRSNYDMEQSLRLIQSYYLVLYSCIR